MKKKEGNALSLVLFLGIVLLVIYSSNLISQKTTMENAIAVKKNVRKAAIACYAIEGAYPQSVEYLEKNYGLQVDYDHFVVSYESVGSNIMPAIAVVEKGTYYFENNWS